MCTRAFCHYLSAQQNVLDGLSSHASHFHFSCFVHSGDSATFLPQAATGAPAAASATSAGTSTGAVAAAAAPSCPTVTAPRPSPRIAAAAAAPATTVVGIYGTVWIGPVRSLRPTTTVALRWVTTTAAAATTASRTAAAHVQRLAIV